MPMHLEIVTAERVVLSDEVDQVNVPTKDGRIGVLPRHMPLLTILATGEMDIIKSGERSFFALAGGFMEVLPNRVTILADTAERAEEIDEERAEAARQRAQQTLEQSHEASERVRAEAELRLAMTRLQVAQLRKNRRR